MHESMEITDRLYGQLGNDDVKAVVTGKKDQPDKAKEALFKDFLAWVEGKDNAN